MDSTGWTRIRSLLDGIASLQPSEWETYLDERCAGRPTLKRAVLELLRAHAEAPTLLETEEFRSAGTTPELGARQLYASGARIDDYVIREFIQEGAFGEVYAADQLAPLKRKVAIKILKQGLDPRSVLARFELERQILAVVDHPNIARVFDAGTTSSGRPYVVMEYVAGVPLTEHCDKHRLPIEERLRLFATVCDAVHHAHQKGIIHRDLKPSNILVAYADGEAVPKVIDFGVAKALDRRLTDQSIYTETGHIIGTLAYMSPEQARLTRQDVDTRSDIYSLGVLLYELLTGERPLDDPTLQAAAFDEKLRMIREYEPPKPSTKLTTGQHRADSQEAARRRKADLSTLSRRLRGDLDWITMCALEKDRTRRYPSASEFALDIRRYLTGEPVSTGPPSLSYRAGKFVRRHRGAVVAALVVAGVLLASVVATTAVVVDGRRTARELGRLQAGRLLEQAKLASFLYPEDARALLQSAVERDPDNESVLLEQARLAFVEGRKEEAISQTESLFQSNPRSGKAAAMLAGMTAASRPAESRRYAAVAEAMLEQDDLQLMLGLAETDPVLAIEHFSESLGHNPWNFAALWGRGVRRFRTKQLDEALADAELAVKVRGDLAQTWILQGAVRLSRNENAEALPALDRAIELDDGIWHGFSNRALALAKLGRLEESLENLNQAIVLRAEDSSLYRRRGWTEFDLERYAEAAESFRRAIELGDDSADVYWDRGWTYWRARDYPMAVADYTAVLERTPQDEAAQPTRAELLATRGHLRMLAGDLAEGIDDVRRALAIEPDSALAEGNWCQLLWRARRYVEAVAHCDRAAQLEPDSATWALQRGMAHWFVNNLEGAVQGLRIYASSDDEDAPWVELWIWEVARLRGDPGAAAAALESAESADLGDLTTIVRHLRGEIDAAALLDAIDDPKNRFRAFYHAGALAELEGRSSDARGHFEQTLGSGFEDQLEHELALWHLGPQPAP